MRAFECTLEIQHKVRLYFPLTQFHILKSQACTSHMQAAQICTLEYGRVLSTPGRIRQAQSRVQPAVRSHRRQQDSPGQTVLSRASTGATNPEQGRALWAKNRRRRRIRTGRELTGRAQQIGKSWYKVAESGQM